MTTSTRSSTIRRRPSRAWCAGPWAHGGADEPAGWFEQRLKDGDCVVLFDGLDEVARHEDRLKVSAWVERQISQFPKNDYVITSRPQGYRHSPIAGATVLQVRPFTDDQVHTFIRGWYLAVELHSTGKATDDVRHHAYTAADDLLRRLDGALALVDLTANPLLLTMIANVHRFRGALPGSRAELYGEICQVMLWRRQEAKHLKTTQPGDKKEALLRGLAFEMMCNGTGELDRSAVIAVFQPLLRRHSTAMTSEDFLADAASNGLLVERENGLYAFAHLTFQEYLAAIHIRDKNLVAVLEEGVNDPWWRETTLLYTASTDADPIVEACLRSGTLAALSLAFACVDDGAKVAPHLRAKLNDELDPISLDLMVRVMLGRYLRTMVPVADRGLITPNPVPIDLFQLFLTATNTRASKATKENGTVIGVRSDVALAFAVWVNLNSDTPVRYRPAKAGRTGAYRYFRPQRVDRRWRPVVSKPPPISDHRSADARPGQGRLGHRFADRGLAERRGSARLPDHEGKQL
ncbi:MAG: NACHT domain-containing protein [Actinomycetota bacterium]|nr:NACHT domain-containing protein [Actinomycetota bacterium]